ncbi:MAG TPA: glycosyltransferase family 4 protein [Burkholderiales bacterium]|nr:glycosyltransferase family 4 protein [Burkholderiales bacterium]
MQRSDAAGYPPTLNQANLLAEAGLRVTLLDGGAAPGALSSLHRDVRLVRPLLDGGISQTVAFVRATRAWMRDSGSRVCIAYDSAACAIVGSTAFAGRKILHFHEPPNDFSKAWTWRTRWRHACYDALSTRAARSADVVSMPDSHRAAVFHRENALRTAPVVIENYARRMETLPQGRLKAELVARGIEARHIVLFQGSVALNYHADDIVRSMPHWPQRSVMVFAGPVEPSLRRVLETIAADNGLLDRVVFLGRIAYPDVLGYTVDADLALTFVKPVSFGFTYSAGASNKRFEAMACGVPQITNAVPGAADLVEGRGVGACIDDATPERIGHAVRRLLEDEPARLAMSAAARRHHLAELNYDARFAWLKNRILAWSSGAR